MQPVINQSAQSGAQAHALYPALMTDGDVYHMSGRTRGSASVSGLLSAICTTTSCSVFQGKGHPTLHFDDAKAMETYGVFGVKHKYDLMVSPDIRYTDDVHGLRIGVPLQVTTACRGTDKVKFDYSLANLSYTTVSNISVEFFLPPSESTSSNNTTLVTTENYGSLTRNSGLTSERREFTVPSSLAPGRYFAGVRIKSTDSAYTSAGELSVDNVNNGTIVNRNPVQIVSCP